MNSCHCHIALAPMPWMRRRVGLDGEGCLGTQLWMMVPSPRSVVVDLRPAEEKEERKQESREAIKLKHIGIFETEENERICGRKKKTKKEDTRGSEFEV